MLISVSIHYANQNYKIFPLLISIIDGAMSLFPVHRRKDDREA